ncbi:MAG: hypothetical protein F6K11_36325 [Leptolyngbya sp. SIO3F4]|nr:hypothetical protein [Leptolyngbya sp. SIO3F4]
MPPSLPVDQISRPPKAVAATVKPSLSSPVIVNSSPLNSSAESATWQADSDLERSVKSFAQFFSGQIVNLEDESVEIKESKADNEQHSSEPGPDVPF